VAITLGPGRNFGSWSRAAFAGPAGQQWRPEMTSARCRTTGTTTPSAGQDARPALGPLAGQTVAVGQAPSTAPPRAGRQQPRSHLRSPLGEPGDELPRRATPPGRAARQHRPRAVPPAPRVPLGGPAAFVWNGRAVPQPVSPRRQERRRPARPPVQIVHQFDQGAGLLRPSARATRFIRLEARRPDRDCAAAGSGQGASSIQRSRKPVRRQTGAGFGRGLAGLRAGAAGQAARVVQRGDDYAADPRLRHIGRPRRSRPAPKAVGRPPARAAADGPSKFEPAVRGEEPPTTFSIHPPPSQRAPDPPRPAARISRPKAEERPTGPSAPPRPGACRPARLKFLGRVA